MRKHLLETVVLYEKCTRNGRETPGKIADHIIPLVRGGTGERSNYQPLCEDCSDAKGSSTRGSSLSRAEWMQREADQPEPPLEQAKPLTALECRL
jgi:5-methylcytosine-specific restriction protein A